MSARDVVEDAMACFHGRALEPCATCRRGTEARPGVRLCRGCLEVAAKVLLAIKLKEANRRALASPGTGEGG